MAIMPQDQRSQIMLFVIILALAGAADFLLMGVYCIPQSVGGKTTPQSRAMSITVQP